MKKLRFEHLERGEGYRYLAYNYCGSARAGKPRLILCTGSGGTCTVQFPDYWTQREFPYYWTQRENSSCTLVEAHLASFWSTVRACRANGFLPRSPFHGPETWESESSPVFHSGSRRVFLSPQAGLVCGVSVTARLLCGGFRIQYTIHRTRSHLRVQ